MKILFLNYDKSIACNHYRSGGIAKDLAKQSGAKIDVMEFPKCEDMAYEFVFDNWLLDDVNKIRYEIIKNI